MRDAVQQFVSPVICESSSDGKTVAVIHLFLHFLFRFLNTIFYANDINAKEKKISLSWLCQHLLQTVYWIIIIDCCF